MTNRKKLPVTPRLWTVGSYVFRSYWRQWDEVLAVAGPAYGQVVTVMGITGPGAGTVRTHSTPLDRKDVVRLPPRTR
jgi:hypothetical protein